MEIAEFAKDKDARKRDFVVVTGETFRNECQEARQMVIFVDVTDETRPVGVSSWAVPEEKRGLLQPRRTLRHALLERELRSRVLQAHHVLRPFQRRGCAHWTSAIPSIPGRSPITFPPSRRGPRSAASARGAEERCKIAIQTNNVEVDERGYIYAVDRANTGMHILRLTGAAREAMK